MLADPYGNAAFSILSGAVTSTGDYDQGLSTSIYPKNVLGVPGFDDNDALGIGPSKANLASPAFSATFTNSAVAQNPTKIFFPLSRNNYYVNGVERERFNLEPHQILDTYGDGYWQSTILNKIVMPGFRTQITYRINEDLTNTGLKIGKTLVINSSSSTIDSGRFFIQNIIFNNCPGSTAQTDITVYDAIHATGNALSLTSAIGANVSLYFNSDSIGFSEENASDFVEISSPFKRHFEIYINQDGYTFSHERGRLSINSSDIVVNNINFYTNSNANNINISKISTKLRGYVFTSIAKINLMITSFNATTGIYSGYLRKWDGTTETHAGPVATGKKGDIVRFYDETNSDYIDFIFSLDSSMATFSSSHIDIQIFPTLSLDDEIMFLGTCQVNGTTNKIEYLRDERQFGNTSENHLSSSALDYISSSTQLINENGIIRGLNISNTGLSGLNSNSFSINGGVAIINGKIVKVNDTVLTIPIIEEYLSSTSVSITTTKWFLCVNDSGRFEFIVSADFDPSGSFNTDYVTAGLDHTRIVNVKNPNDSTGTYYPVKATYFSNLLITKNLVPIAVITAPITTNGSDYIIDEAASVFKDARRFISNGYSGLSSPLTFGTNANFRTFESLDTWLKELNNYKAGTVNIVNGFGEIVLVKDSMDVSGKSFSYGKRVKFVGDGGRFVISTAATMKDIHLENLKIYTAIGNAITFDGYGNDIEQCYISHNTTASVWPIVIAASSSVRFTKNVFTSSVSITAFVRSLETSIKQIFIGNVYKSGTTLTAATNILPTSITTLNAADGA